MEWLQRQMPRQPIYSLTLEGASSQDRRVVDGGITAARIDIHVHPYMGPTAPTEARGTQRAIRTVAGDTFGKTAAIGPTLR